MKGALEVAQDVMDRLGPCHICESLGCCAAIACTTPESPTAHWCSTIARPPLLQFPLNMSYSSSVP